jgi:hypothetical protein
MTHIGYSMTAEVKILRRKHKVTFRVGMRAVDLIDALKHVPSDAIVDEVLDGENYSEDMDLASIEFHEEVVEK